MCLEPGSLALTGYIPRPSTSADWFAQRHSIPNILVPFPLRVRRFLTSCPHPRFCDTGSLRSLPEKSRFDEMGMEERTLRHRRKVDRPDRWTGTCTIVVPGGGSHDYSPALGTVDTGTIFVTDGLGTRTGTKAGIRSIHSSADVGFYRPLESPRRTIELLPLGRSSEMESRLVGFPVTGDAGKQPCEPGAGNEKGGKWGESGSWTCPGAGTADMIPIEGEDSGSDSLLQSTGPVRSDRVEGMIFNNLVSGSCWVVDAMPIFSAGLECKMEGCDLVPGHDLREGTWVCSKPSSCRRDGRGCGVSDWKSRRIDESGETERLDEFVPPTPTDPYIDFAFGLDGISCGDSKRTSEPSVADGFDYPSVSETLRRLESAIGLPTGAETTVNLIPMDFDVTISESIPQLPSSGEGETQGWGKLNNSSSSRLPFQFSTSKFPTLAPSSLWPVVRDHTLTDLDLSSSLDAPVEAGPRTLRVSATVSGSGPASGSVEFVSALTNPGSAEIQEVFSGPRLFADDDCV